MAFIGDLQSSGVATAATAAAAKSLVVVSKSCIYFGADGFNNSGSTMYIMIFDLAALPANGVVTPKHIIQVPTVTNWAHGGAYYGEYFANGIVIAASSTLISAGNFSLTLDSAADQFIACDYATEYGQYT